MKKSIFAALLLIVILGVSMSVGVEKSQAIVIGGPCDTALDTYGGQNAAWNFMCREYAIAIYDCINEGNCDHYVP